jgi:hypothetical protein
MTAIEWIISKLPMVNDNDPYYAELIDQAKEVEKNNTDNKAIHFAEWLTKKHTTVLITLYEQFEEQYYNEEL